MEKFNIEELYNQFVIEYLGPEKPLNFLCSECKLGFDIKSYAGSQLCINCFIRMDLFEESKIERGELLTVCSLKHCRRVVENPPVDSFRFRVRKNWMKLHRINEFPKNPYICYDCDQDIMAKFKIKLQTEVILEKSTVFNRNV